MQSALDSIFKVGFGVYLNCLEGSSKEGSAFIKAFDDLNAFTYWRYVDPIWKLKRFFNIGCEASLRNNIRLINGFVLNLINKRREQFETNQHCVSFISSLLTLLVYHSNFYPVVQAFNLFPFARIRVGPVQ
ncbi:putative abieta-7,13-dien-18-ol hydroxylase [Helianthus anomalus]